MSEPKTITIKNWYPFRFVIDPDDAGATQSIDLRIKRLTVDQGKAFNARWAAVNSYRSSRSIFRKSDGDEQARTEKGAFVVDEGEIRRRRLGDMDDEAFAAFLKQEQADMDAEMDFLVEAVTQYIRVAPGQRVLFEPDEGEPFEVQAGADLVRMFGGSRVLLGRLVAAIWSEANLTGMEKNVWRLLSGLRPTSTPPATDGGARPDAIAASVDPAASAATADATVFHEPIPSGSTVN